MRFFIGILKAIGYESRNKYHVYICEENWQFPNTFLFISKANYSNDFLICKADYPFLPLPQSFIGCEQPVMYTDDELAQLAQRPIGNLIAPHYDELANHLLGCDVMEKRHIDRICKALRSLR